MAAQVTSRLLPGSFGAPGSIADAALFLASDHVGDRTDRQKP
ncbi:hypothetical protein FHW79_002495 [Azospirillum sp. OGB3]|nr:hypothetical protein [Azospirillum sp. OGB3]MBB3264875.1 hypothetical protein [Azospirillum sp. OGB3]